MRPVEKGISPYKELAKYQDAEPYLVKKLGTYCSFCEMRVNNALAVEHKESKKSGGALTDWDNLLLACTYCNSRKGEKIKKGELDKWIWPDMHNTCLAFTYNDGIPKVNEQYLASINNSMLLRAKKTYSDLALGYYPEKGQVPRYKDKRWSKRFETYRIAEDIRKNWMRCKDTEFKNMQISTILDMAKGYGFFSVWLKVFEDEPEIKKELIKVFPGTDESSFDENGNFRRREKSEL